MAKDLLTKNHCPQSGRVCHYVHEVNEFIINVHKVDDFVKFIKWMTSSQEDEKFVHKTDEFIIKSTKWMRLSMKWTTLLSP